MISQPSPGATPDQQIYRGSLREQVSSRILMAVFQGRFRSGERLVVQKLATLYGVSPTPVREALVELAGLGTVVLVPNRGAVVCPFGPQQVREISQIRRVLEVEAARGAATCARREELAELRAELIRLDALNPDDQWDRDARAADNWLHGMIATSSGSERLAAEVNRYLTLFRALRDVSHMRDAWTNFSRSNDVPEHLAIIDQLLAGNPEAAGAAMERHIRSAATTLEVVLFGPGAAAGPGDRGDATAQDSVPKRVSRQRAGASLS